MILIDANELDNVVARLNSQGWQITRNDYKLIERVLFEFPLVDAVPFRRGEWEEHIFDGTMGCRPRALMCSKCNFISLNAYNYCPHCGAWMEETE